MSVAHVFIVTASKQEFKALRARINKLSRECKQHIVPIIKQVTRLDQLKGLRNSYIYIAPLSVSSETAAMFVAAEYRDKNVVAVTREQFMSRLTREWNDK